MFRFSSLLIQKTDVAVIIDDPAVSITITWTNL